MKMSKLPITRHIKLRKGVKVYGSDKETVGYSQKREYRNALNQIYSTKVERVYKRQKGICPYCHQPVTDIWEVDTHHVLPVRYGGKERLNNLWLLHQNCHKSLHSEHSLEQMRDAVRNGESYLQSAAEGESCMR